MRYETVLAELGRLRHGIIRVEDAVAAGVSLSDLRNLRRRRGVLVPVGRGVQRLRDHPFDLDCRRQAALDLAGDGAVLGLRTAARLPGFYAYRDRDEIEVVSPTSEERRVGEEGV